MKPYQRGDVVIIDVPIPASGHVQGLSLIHISEPTRH